MTTLDLEPGQLLSHTSVPVARAVLTPAVRAGLWGLRVFTIVLAAMVVCAFVLPLV